MMQPNDTSNAGVTVQLPSKPEQRALATVLEIAKRITVEDTTCWSSEVAPDEVCFFCGVEVVWNRGLTKRTVHHSGYCDVVRLREALEVLNVAEP